MSERDLGNGYSHHKNADDAWAKEFQAWDRQTDAEFSHSERYKCEKTYQKENKAGIDFISGWHEDGSRTGPFHAYVYGNAFENPKITVSGCPDFNPSQARPEEPKHAPVTNTDYIEWKKQ